MAYTAKELRPNKIGLTVGDSTLTLSFLTLEKQVALQDIYGSVNDAFHSISKDPMNILKLSWFFIEDKIRFNNSFKTFSNFCFKSKEATNVWSQEMKKCLDLIIESSMPLIKNQKRYSEIRKIKAAQSDNGKDEVCYGVYYDFLAKRYNYTIEDFYQLTLRQIHILLNVIDDESYKELATQAALAGRQLRPRLKFDDISEEQEAEQDKEALETLERLKQDYLKRQKEDK